MKKVKLAVIVATTIVAGMCYSGAIANSNQDLCSVLGVHEPNSNIYDGPTFCRNVKLSNITVRGPLQVNESQIGGSTDVSGPIKASGSTFKDVQIEKQIKAVEITLNGGTKVEGNVTFLGKKGIVDLSGGSCISGKVINGTVVKK